MLQKQHNWWNKPLKIIQTNLQVLDTEKINPGMLVRQIKEMGANVLVFNVGGIYAWYPTGIPYHNVNPYLPKDADLLKEVIAACHEEDMYFVARFDFSKAEDWIYLQRPQWFARKADGEPEIIGEKRPGNWSLMLTTCINGGYRGNEAAIPILDEVLKKYDIDGIFLNNPNYALCGCEACQRKYYKKYGKELPANKEEMEKDWASDCIQDNIELLYSFIKKINEEVPLILYYSLNDCKVAQRSQVADLICAEPQDILSLGEKNIPQPTKPILYIKLGKTLKDYPTPLGIIHSSPGMDWRHTGLPHAEYIYWLSLIPASGGHIWHSLTGIPETITDKRILKTVTELDAHIGKIEKIMDGASSAAKAVLLWDGSGSATNLAEGLINCQLSFDLMLEEQVSRENLLKYQVVILPEMKKIHKGTISMIKDYVKDGGNIICEGMVPKGGEDLYELLGIDEDIFSSENLKAAYLRFEDSCELLRNGLEEVLMIPFRGRAVYSKALKGTKTLMTLVPPFSPLESVGAPPERASLPVARTDIPMAILNDYGTGKALYFPFSLSSLIYDYRLEDHYRLLNNAVRLLLGSNDPVQVTQVKGLYLSVFRKEDDIVINLVNGVGQRPLMNNIALSGIKLTVTLDKGEKIVDVSNINRECEIEFFRAGKNWIIPLQEVGVWETIQIRTEKSNA